jgi:HlyD family secretion protein/adhesin transport system membrane fusion protein
MAKLSEKQKRFLSQAVRLEETTNPAFVRRIMVLISLFILAFIIWASVTNINEVAHASGEVVTQGHQQVVQHLEGGIVRDIHVKEGQRVKRGDILLTLDGAGSEDDLERAMAKKISLALQEERLRAFIDNRSPNFSAYQANHPDLVRDQEQFFTSMVKSRREERRVIAEQIEQKKRSISTLESDLRTARENHKITKNLYERRAVLNKKGYVSDVQYLETKKLLNDIEGSIRQTQNRISVTRSEISEFENRLSSLDAQQRDQAYERLDQVMNEAAQNKELLEKLSSRVGRLDIKSPTEGLIKGLSLNTIGAVVQPGQVLMEVVPLDEKLVIQVKIPPQHIGHIKPGQNVQVKFSSYDFSRYGMAVGMIEQISASTFQGERGERYYEGRVSLEHSYVGRNPENTVVPGMTVMVDIITGEKTVLDYLLKPIQIAMNTSFTER